jgi:hypothetical protein
VSPQPRATRPRGSQENERGCAGTPAPPAGEIAREGAITLVLPLPPRLTNSAKGRSRHWRALHREKRAYWEAVDLRRMLKRIPPPPAEPMEQAEVSATLYLWSPMDDDGALARMKWILDWLVRRGYLVDDSRKHLRWTALPEQVIDRKEPRVEVTLTPVL